MGGWLGWLAGWMDGWMDGWTDGAGWMHGWMSRYTSSQAQASANHIFGGAESLLMIADEFPDSTYFINVCGFFSIN